MLGFNPTGASGGAGVFASRPRAKRSDRANSTMSGRTSCSWVA
jgi:hypothetical protein